MTTTERYAALLADAENLLDEVRALAPAVTPCGYVNRAGDVTACKPDHDTAEDIRARMRATGGYLRPA
jgi:hypothetical protein